MTNSNNEQRSEQRFPTRGLFIKLPNEEITCEVANINLGGLMATAKQNLEIETDDELEVELVENNVKLPLRARVAWCKPEDRQFGLQFVWRSEGVRNLVEKIMQAS